MKDFKFVRYLTKEKVNNLIKIKLQKLFYFILFLFQQLATIPVTGFYTADHRYLAENYIRFCFAKVRYNKTSI